MNVGPMSGIIGSAAGAPLSQTKGSETERAQKDAVAGQRQADSEKKAEKAAGVGETTEDQGVSERDADGRRLWEQAQGEEVPEAENAAASEPPRQTKDPTGNSGNSLDLTG
ncbi:MAG: hypothetical protein GXP28_05295 [Planctomycetes bacterium]|nr:hypothetical protein [Planctomycetota bacterium]